MSVDVFGRKLPSEGGSSSRGPPGIGFKLTEDGQYDLENKKLCNVAAPTQPNDAVNLKTLDTRLIGFRKILHEMRQDIIDLERTFNFNRVEEK